jgi:hypothetical protein
LFYYYLENNSPAVADIQVRVDTDSREYLVLIFQHNLEIFIKIIQSDLSKKNLIKNKAGYLHETDPSNTRAIGYLSEK